MKPLNSETMMKDKNFYSSEPLNKGCDGEFFKFPEKWCIKGGEHLANDPDFQKWAERGSFKGVLSAFYHYNGKKLFSWSNSIQPGYTYITLEEFKKHVLGKEEEKVEIPEHWYIEVTKDNIEEVTEYMLSIRYRFPQWTSTWTIEVGFKMVSSPGDGGGWAYGRVNKIPSRYKKISTEFFRKHIFKKQNKTMEKELIGYDLKSLKSDAIVALNFLAGCYFGTDIELWETLKEREGVHFRLNEDQAIINELKKLNLIDKFLVPVYKEKVESLTVDLPGENKIIRIMIKSPDSDKINVMLFDEKDQISYIENSISFSQLKELYLETFPKRSEADKKILPWAVIREQVQIGCVTGIKCKDVQSAYQQILRYAKKHKHLLAI